MADWLEAFAAHPRIGDVDALKAKFSNFVELSQSEQSAASSASGDVLQVAKRLIQVLARDLT